MASCGRGAQAEAEYCYWRVEKARPTGSEDDWGVASQTVSPFSPRFVVVKVFAFVCLLVSLLFSVSITLEEEDDDDGSAMARRGIVRDNTDRFINARLPLAVACACALV